MEFQLFGVNDDNSLSYAFLNKTQNFLIKISRGNVIFTFKENNEAPHRFCYYMDSKLTYNFNEFEYCIVPPVSWKHFTFSYGYICNYTTITFDFHIDNFRIELSSSKSKMLVYSPKAKLQ
jgi:hypothetical protein